MSEVALEITGLSKKYTLYNNQFDRVMGALGFDSFLFWRGKRGKDFWALRDIDLTVRKGERLGIIGRNGAGKSTLLKIITGNIEATEGTVRREGKIHALMELGTGFHPEFSGRENIRLSLTCSGIGGRELKKKEEEIIEFAELGGFIDQPVRTYSAGMYARLAFSTATSIEPEILIIDEILGAGDAYFSGKCVERMKKLTEQNGATVLFVSHALESVERMCSRVIWLERGRIVMDGPPLEVTKAYQRAVRRQTEMRLLANNIKRRMGGQERAMVDLLMDTILFRLTADGECNDFALQRAVLYERWKEQLQEVADLQVGGAQDDSAAHTFFVVNGGESFWSEPVLEKNGMRSRRLVKPAGSGETGRSRDTSAARCGLLALNMWIYEPSTTYVLRLEVIPDTLVPVRIEVYNGEKYILLGEIPPSSERKSREFEYVLPELFRKTARSGNTAAEAFGQETDLTRSREPEESECTGHRSADTPSRWPGTGEVIIERVELLDRQGYPRTVFDAGDTLAVRIVFRAGIEGLYPIIFTAVIFRVDGVRVSCHISERKNWVLRNDRIYEVYLEFDKLNLGNGTYLFSIALYKELDPELRSEPVLYDLHDRSYEFMVCGRSAIDCAVFHHDSRWRLTCHAE